MPRKNLTIRTVASLVPPKRGQVDYWDSNLSGFGLRVSHGGTKTWGLKFRLGRRQCRMKLGTFPPMGLAEARAEASSALLLVQRGEDPGVARKARRDAETFAQLADLYLEKYARPKKKSWYLDKKALDRDVLPRFRRKKARDITKRDIRDLVEAIIERGSPIQANRTFEMVRGLFNWAVKEDYLQESPCRGLVKPAKENQRDRVLREDEIRAVWLAFEQENPAVSAICKLRLITAQRGIEVMSMRWQDVDMGASWWTIPADRAKNGLSHRVPLGPTACDILQRLRKDSSDRVWVFPSPIHERDHLENLVQATARLRKASGVDFVPHDLRRTAASRMTGDLSMSRLVVSKILNHVERGVTAVYDRHSYDREKRQALEAWDRRLGEIVRGKPNSSDNVVSLGSVDTG